MIENTNLTNKDPELEKKIDLIKKNLQEITDEDIMRKIVSQRPLKVYWGTAITGSPHIAYFIPIMKIRDFISAGCVVKILLADVHGFLDNLKAPIDKIALRRVYYENLIKSMLKRLGVGMNSVEIVYGSNYQYSKEYVFDMFRMSSYTTINDCKKAGTEVVKQAENPVLSSLLYPNMQALDEEYLDVDAQFGGVDQRKIFMHSAKYMPKLGYKKRIYLMNHMMPGLNSDKMSSSEELGKIDLLDDKKKIEKKIKKCFCEPGNVATGILVLFKFLIFPLELFEIEICGVIFKSYDELEKAFGKEEIHPGDLKEACSTILDRLLAPIRDDMAEYTELIKKAYN